MLVGLNTSRSHMWGFDSFQGMPDSDATDRAHHQHVSSWRSGGLNAAEQLKLTRWSELRAAILGNIAHGVAGRVHPCADSSTKASLQACVSHERVECDLLGSSISTVTSHRPRGKPSVS